MMKNVNIPARLLKTAIATVEGVLPRNSPNKAWNHVVIHVERDGEACCYGTDGRLAAVSRLPHKGISTPESEPFRCMLCRKSLSAIKTAKDDDLISLGHEPQAITKTQPIGRDVIQHGQTHHDIITIKILGATYNIEAKSLPIWEPESVSFDDCVEFNPGHFIEMTSLLGGICDEDEYRYNLSGIHITEDADKPAMIKASATDGRRIGIGYFPAVRHGEGCVHPESEPVIPRYLVRAVKGPVSSCESTVKIRFTDSRCFIRVGETTYYGAIAIGKFPSMSRAFQMFDKDGFDAGSIRRELFNNALELARICTNPKCDAVGVRITSDPPTLSFDSSAPDVGKARVLLEPGITKPFSLMLDPAYLVPILSSLKDDYITVKVVDDLAVMIETKTFQYVLMGITN